MIKVITPNLNSNHLMGSQSGNISELGAFSGHSPCMLGSDTEPDSSRQDYANSSQLPSDMGLRYMSLPSTDDVRFNSDSGTSSSPEYSTEPAVQNTSSSSTLTFSPYTNIFQPSLNGSTFPSIGGSYPSFPTSSLFSMPDLKPRLSSMNNSPGLAPLSRSPALPHPISPISTRELYTGATPHLRRTSDLLYRSPSASTIRGIPHSPSTGSGFTSPVSNMDSSSERICPPLSPTEVHYQLQSPDGQMIKPEIFARIDKGFFLADNDWTCYRRNYFSLNCSYTLQPHLPNGMPYLVQHGQQGSQITQFAMCIAAVVDGRDGKPIELVQHTPKRDKGPQEKPARITLAPRPPASHIYGSSDHSSGSLYSTQSFSTSPNQPAMEATFERIQFKNATANNGKRRAAQQYYHLLVELYAEVGSNGPERWVKIATRISAPMVVRGRSPGHYQSERRGSNTSTGGGSSGGPSGYGGSGSAGRHGSDVGMSGMGGSSGGGPFGAGYDTRGHHFRGGIGSLSAPMEPTPSHDEEKSISGSEPSYFYHPASVWENQSHVDRYSHRPPPTGLSGTYKMKSEFRHGAFVLPSLDSGSLARGCGRWEGVEGSKGYFPTASLVPELNIT